MESGTDKPIRKNNRIKHYDYSQNGAYFITICTRDRRRILSEITVGTPLLGCPQLSCEEHGCYKELVPSIRLLLHGEIAEKNIRQMDAFYENISVDKYVIMPDHIHLLITIHGGHPRTGVPTRTSTVGCFVGTFKRFCNKEYGENVWQSRFYDHVIRNQQDYDDTWTYIENNPRKWAMEKDI